MERCLHTYLSPSLQLHYFPRESSFIRKTENLHELLSYSLYIRNHFDHPPRSPFNDFLFDLRFSLFMFKIHLAKRLRKRFASASKIDYSFFFTENVLSAFMFLLCFYELAAHQELDEPSKIKSTKSVR